MYDPTVGQFLSEDPIDFEGLDENLRRYVHNRVTTHVDPDGLQEAASAQAAPQDLLTIPIVVIDMTTRPKAGTLSDQILEGTNQILKQCDVMGTKAGFIFPGSGTAKRITFDARTHKFSGGTHGGKTLRKFLGSVTAGDDVVYVILVDEITGLSSPTFGLAYRPEDPNGAAIVLAVDPPPHKLNDSPQPHFSP